MYDTVSSSVNPVLIATVVTVRVIMEPMLNDYCMLWLSLDLSWQHVVTAIGWPRVYTSRVIKLKVDT